MEAARSRLPKTVLFVSDRNSCRSQIAAAIFNRIANPSVARAASAGIRPAKRVHPSLEPALREIGIVVRAPAPQLASPDQVAKAHVLITLGCGDSCPTSAAMRRDDWSLPEVSGPAIDDVRDVRHRIESLVRSLIAAKPWE